MPHRGSRPASGSPAPAPAPRRVASGGWFGVLMLAAGLLAGPSVAAGQTPASIMGMISSTTVSSADESRIESYVNHYADQLASGGDAAAEAVERLLEPVSTTAASRSFRGAFGRVAVDRLGRILSDPPSPFVATNALVILSKVGTPGALAALVREADGRDQGDWWIRLAAARGARQLLKDARGDAIDDRTRLRTSRDLSEMAARETDARVLRHVLLAIVQADASQLEPGTRADIHGHLASALSTVAGRIREDASLAPATGLAVAAIRDTFLGMLNQRDVQLEFSRRLAPAMIELLAAYEGHWPADGSDAAATHALDIQRIETGLEFMVRAANPAATIPSPPAAEAWSDRNRGGFTSAVGAWRATLR
ncbi:MAG: hypothetical protein ACYTEV_01050 [Planctomycetota bacterium]